MMYQIKQVAPYWVKTVVLRRKGLVSPTLYKTDFHNDEFHDSTEYASKGGDA